MKRILAFSVVLLILAGNMVMASDVAELDKQAARSITLDEIVNHIFFLASDELGGRLPGTDGYRVAAQYAATQFQAAGALPLVLDESGTPTYYQGFALRRSGTAPDSAMTIGDKRFKHGKGFAVLSLGKEKELNIDPAQVVFVGYGITSEKAGWDDYEGIDAEGKFVALLLGAPMKNGEPMLPEEVHKYYRDPQQSIMPKFMNAKRQGAAGLLVLPSDVNSPTSDMSWDTVLASIASPRLSMAANSQQMNPMAFFDLPFMLVGSSAGMALMEGAAFDPVSGKGDYATFAVEKDVSFTITSLADTFTTHNVVAYVPGTDEKLRDEFVTIGAHLDHVGDIGSGIHNGADDNASGSTAVLEVAEAIAMNPTRRSAVFILYSAEESGLIGSEYFVENAPFDMDNAVVNLNMDMVGRDTETAPDGIQVIGSSMGSPELKEIIIDVNEQRAKLALDFSTDEADPLNLARRSDHYNFYVKGVPVAFLHTGLHGQYHTPDDDPSLVSPEKIQRVSLLCYDLIQYIGNREERLQEKP